MAINNKYFLKPNDPLLKKTAEAIPLKDINIPQTKLLIEKMLKVGYGEQTIKEKPLLVGLAAPQIGISKRIILVDVASDGKGNVGDLKVFINPEIVWSSKKCEEWYEGCFSTSRVCGIVSRPVSIKLKAYNLEGNIIEEKFTGYTARIFQHEIDHLNGSEFVNYIKDESKLHWVEEDEFKEYRNNQAWRNWPKKCSFEKWKQIKGLK